MRMGRMLIGGARSCNPKDRQPKSDGAGQRESISRPNCKYIRLKFSENAASTKGGDNPIAQPNGLGGMQGMLVA